MMQGPLRLAQRRGLATRCRLTPHSTIMTGSTCQGVEKRYPLSSAITQNHHQQPQRFLATTPVFSEDEEERRYIAADLFDQYSQVRSGEDDGKYNDLRELLRGIGEAQPPDKLIREIFDVADSDRNGYLDLQEFLDHSDFILGKNPARIILLVGGPGCGKGTIAERLQEICHVVHLSSGDMLRDEVAQGSALGKQVQEIMARGELVSSAVIVALMKKHMHHHPGKRVLLDGFPRSAENAQDLITYCGTPELALHLHCDDTILLERIIGRGADLPAEERREDDNFKTALERLRTFHKHHPSTLEWLKDHCVPIINLDCSGPPETVWGQLEAIGRLMRPAVKVPFQ
mmetsp:Transcript_17053/g.46763  ORF Transcript_17053/g.46763 Transcript_17053/m.46763 type:complete len:344 (+) Transcript_17053:73-1104(+)|eukprot:CAMPEP_0168779450 /NCGR_PEP_ID=MMETSP0725-20121227/7612_1 /TAXON_ID=265536 /ORGANISM="Amphiprora sp., Strain CCMP467" /LENGTH=343 /DNA_ID=CAMNT_0008829267 /DNA_START=16 /DNA_END=1047 /DNA_ORIENTATION=-